MGAAEGEREEVHDDRTERSLYRRVLLGTGCTQVKAKIKFIWDSGLPLEVQSTIFCVMEDDVLFTDVRTLVSRRWRKNAIN